MTTIQENTYNTPYQVNKPSKQGLPFISSRDLPESGDDSKIAWATRLIQHAHNSASEIYEIAQSIIGDENLSTIGQRKKIAKEAFNLVKSYNKRAHELSAGIKNEIHETEKKVKSTFGNNSIDDARASEIRSWFRSISLEEKYKVIRQASRGEMSGGDEIMEAVTSGFPALSGFKENDTSLRLARDTWMQTKVPNELHAISIRETTVANLDKAQGWLVSYAKSLAPAEFDEITKANRLGES